VKPRLKGKSTLVRFADDAVMAFADFQDAKRVLDVLGKLAAVRFPSPFVGEVERRSAAAQQISASSGFMAFAFERNPRGEATLGSGIGGDNPQGI